MSPAPSPGDPRRAALIAAMAGTAQHDERAFATLYNLVGAKLFGICLRICRERKAAEDVLQEVFLTIWQRAASYDATRGSAISWLATIARNRAIDWRRSHQAPPPSPVEAARDVVDDRPSARDVMMMAESDRTLYACLETLEPEQRDAIRAAFFEGLTYAQLAERRGVPLGTMKSWVRRGLLKMRERLDDDS